MRSSSVGTVLIGCALFVLHSVTLAAESFEVHGVATDSTLYTRGKVERQTPGDEVTYLVDLEKGVIIRTAVFNKSILKGPLSGLQADKTVYKIVFDQLEPLFAKQRLIKGVGQAGSIDGFETIVIGEDFITTARSTSDYFALYYYKRVDPSLRIGAQ